MSTDWVGLSQAAEFLGVHPATVRGWADKGYLPSQRTPGGHRRFRRADLEAWLTNQKSGPSAEAQLLVQTAIGRARLEMGEGQLSQADWYRGLDETARQIMRGYGRQIMEMLQNYLTEPSPEALVEAHQLGEKYGQTVRTQHLDLVSATKGFLTYQHFVLESVISVTEMAYSNAAWSQVMRDVLQVTREILLGMLEAFGTAKP